MELEITVLNDLSQTQNGKQEFHDLYHVWETGSGRT